FRSLVNPLATESERRDSLAESAHLARDGVLVEHPAGNPTRHLWLGGLKRGLGGILVTGIERQFDLLHEAADAAHARAVDLGALVVAADALLGLRRIGHISPYIGPLAC